MSMFLEPSRPFEGAPIMPTQERQEVNTPADGISEVVRRGVVLPLQALDTERLSQHKRTTVTSPFLFRGAYLLPKRPGAREPSIRRRRVRSVPLTSGFAKQRPGR